MTLCTRFGPEGLLRHHNSQSWEISDRKLKTLCSLYFRTGIFTKRFINNENCGKTQNPDKKKKKRQNIWHFDF